MNMEKIKKALLEYYKDLEAEEIEVTFKIEVHSIVDCLGVVQDKNKKVKNIHQIIKY